MTSGPRVGADGQKVITQGKKLPTEVIPSTIRLFGLRTMSITIMVIYSKETTVYTEHTSNNCPSIYLCLSPLQKKIRKLLYKTNDDSQSLHFMRIRHIIDSYTYPFMNVLFVVGSSQSHSFKVISTDIRFSISCWSHVLLLKFLEKEEKKGQRGFYCRS